MNMLTHASFAAPSLARRYHAMLAALTAIAALRTDSELDGDMSNDQAVDQLGECIDSARGVLHNDFHSQNDDAQPAEVWEASDYAVSSGEEGACVKHGDDTICDLPYDAGYTREQREEQARRITASVNACRGFDLAVLEAAPDFFHTLLAETSQHGSQAAALKASNALLLSALVALKDLKAGYPWRELGIDLPELLALAAELGVAPDDEED